MSPEAEELLREIAADPRSSLLKVPRRKRDRGLIWLSEAGFEKHPGRTRSPAERQLAEVQRNEVARVIREVCKDRLVNDAATKATVNAHTREAVSTSGIAAPTVSGPVAFYDEDVEEALGLLYRNSHPSPEEDRPSVGQLATIAHKLSPHHNSQLHIAIDLIYKGQTQTARGLLRRATTNSHDLVKASLLESSAFSWALDREPGKAFAEFFNAYRLGSPRPASILSAYLNALDWGDVASLKWTARIIDDSLCLDHPAVRHFIQGHLIRKRAGKIKTTEQGRRLARSSDLQLGSVSSRLVEAYAD